MAPEGGGRRAEGGARPPPRNHSSNLEGSGRGGGFYTSPTFSAARESIAVISGSGSDNATTPEGGNAAESSSPERAAIALRCSDRHLVIRGSTEGNGWSSPLCRVSSPIQRHPRQLRSAWGVRNSTWGSPHRNPQITSDSTRCCAALCARTNARSRQRQRDPAMFDIAETIAQLQDGHVPTRRTWTIHESLHSVLNAQTREAAIVTVLRHQKPTTPRKARSPVLLF